MFIIKAHACRLTAATAEDLYKSYKIFWKKEVISLFWELCILTIYFYFTRMVVADCPGFCDFFELVLHLFCTKFDHSIPKNNWNLKYA